MKHKMNKKGIAAFTMVIFLIVGLIILMFFSGSLSGLLIRGTLSKIPTWFWIGLVLFILIVLGRRKK